MTAPVLPRPPAPTDPGPPCAGCASCSPAALVEGEQVALLRTADGWVHAVGQQAVRSGAMVMVRGLVGSREDVRTLAGPLYKQVFDLRTGQCLDDPDQRLPVHEVAVVGGLVRVRLGAPGCS